MATYTTPKTGSKALVMSNTATATKLTSKPIPCTENKPMLFEAEFKGSSTTGSHTAQVQIRWETITGTLVSTETIFDSAPATADEWEYIRSYAWPPNTAARCRVILAKGSANAYYLAWDRVKFEPAPNTLDRKACQAPISEDFVKYSATAPWGEWGWQEFTLSGSLQAAQTAPTTAGFDPWSEVGVITIESGNGAGQGGGLTLTPPALAPFYGRPPMGASCRFKLSVPSNNINATYWGGLWDSITTYPDAATSNTIRGIGFRAAPAGVAANWYGVVRNGTSETTVDLGVTADSTWYSLGWRRTLTGIQFLVGDDSVGSVQTSNLPAASAKLTPLFGVRSDAVGTVHSLSCDSVHVDSFMNRWGR